MTHFMLKEIYEQPDVIRHLLAQLCCPEWVRSISIPLQNVDRINILACGTSLHAGLIGQYLFEQVAKISTQVRSSSESLSASLLETPNTITIAMTQSGETADTIAALQTVQSKRIAITNGFDSAITKQVDHTIYTNAGEEKSVAATKTFTAQLVILYRLAFELAYQKYQIDQHEFEANLELLRQIPEQIEAILKQNTIAQIAKTLKDTRDLILIASGINTAIALEGALKLKEATYTHAEAYAAGEFLHGSIALLDPQIPTIALFPETALVRKTVDRIRSNQNHVIEISTAAFPERFTPFLTVVPLQLLAYEIAVLRKIDVDRPRNITKSLAI